MKMEGISKLQSQQNHQAPCILHPGYVNSPVLGRDMASHTTGYQEAEDLPHEMSPRYPLWDRRRNTDILEETGELPIEEQLRQKRLQWFGHVQRMSDERPQKQLMKCQPRGKKRAPGGASLRWVDVVSKDMTKLTNWQEVVKDRAVWRAFIHRP